MFNKNNENSAKGLGEGLKAMIFLCTYYLDGLQQK